MPESAAHIPAPRKKLTDDQRLAWLRLIRSENVGPVTFRELVNHFGGAEAALERLPELSKRGGKGRSIVVASAALAEEEIKQARRIGSSLVAIGEHGYPPRLAKLDAPPPLLHIKGDFDIAHRPAIAIVGSRNGSAIGGKFTRQLAVELGGEGFVIVSGLARGIDRQAHLAALERGTIAVLAGGIDIFYPQENTELQSQIASTGLLVSERPPGFTPRGQDFPRRNRIVSGVSVGVVVIEAAQRSGSLITARFALEQGREVFAVPGNPLDPRAAGTNKLIKDGATLVTGVRDIIDVIAPILGGSALVTGDLFSSRSLEEDNDTGEQTEAPIIEQSQREQVICALGPVPTDIDELIRATNLSVREVRVILLELDLAGRLERHGSQLVSLLHEG